MLNYDSRVQIAYAGDTADGCTLHCCKRFVNSRVCKMPVHGVLILLYIIQCVGIYFLSCGILYRYLFFRKNTSIIQRGYLNYRCTIHYYTLHFFRATLPVDILNCLTPTVNSKN